MNKKKMRMRAKSFSLLINFNKEIDFHARITIQKNRKKYKSIKETYYTNFVFKFIFFKTNFYSIWSLLR